MLMKEKKIACKYSVFVEIFLSFSEDFLIIGCRNSSEARRRLQLRIKSTERAASYYLVTVVVVVVVVVVGFGAVFHDVTISNDGGNDNDDGIDGVDEKFLFFLFFSASYGNKTMSFFVVVFLRGCSQLLSLPTLPIVVI